MTKGISLSALEGFFQIWKHKVWPVVMMGGKTTQEEILFVNPPPLISHREGMLKTFSANSVFRHPVGINLHYLM